MPDSNCRYHRRAFPGKSTLRERARGVFGSTFAQSTVTYGKTTVVKGVTKENKDAQVAGVVTGGMIGLLSGRGHSGSNKALRTIGGGFAGQQIGRLATNRQAYEYTILIGEATTRIVTDESGLRVGDCVALERGERHVRLLCDD